MKDFERIEDIEKEQGIIRAYLHEIIQHSNKVMEFSQDVNAVAGRVLKQNERQNKQVERLLTNMETILSLFKRIAKK